MIHLCNPPRSPSPATRAERAAWIPARPDAVAHRKAVTQPWAGSMPLSVKHLARAPVPLLHARGDRKEEAVQAIARRHIVRHGRAVRHVPPVPRDVAPLAQLDGEADVGQEEPPSGWLRSPRVTTDLVKVRNGVRVGVGVGVRVGVRVGLVKLRSSSGVGVVAKVGVGFGVVGLTQRAKERAESRSSTCAGLPAWKRANHGCLVVEGLILTTPPPPPPPPPPLPLPLTLNVAYQGSTTHQHSGEQSGDGRESTAPTQPHLLGWVGVEGGGGG
jgi:hypothetical protein